MRLINEKLEQSLLSGFINKDAPAHNEYLPQLLVNDKREGKKVLSTILKELSICDEFWFSVAFVTTSGVATLIDALNSLAIKGIKGKILVSQYLNFTQPEALRRLIQFENLEVKIAIDNAFHSKGYLFKKNDVYDLIIGSSNLTASAFSTNTEWNLKVTATPVSYIIFNAIKEFSSEFQKALSVDNNFINRYEILYKKQIDYSKLLKKELLISNRNEITPNSMQIEALKNIEGLRKKGKSKALLISATGTGKTYLSAFDVKKVNPKKFLFVVHRLNIAQASLNAYKAIFGEVKSMGIYSGSKKDLDSDFIFSTVQTISKEENLLQFNPKQFDYIVIDETHRAGAESYKKILDYFEPKFLLGMTATPERTDRNNIFKLFDYNIAYEIRLHRAMEEAILCPFHYYGISDLTVNGEILEDLSDFNKLVSHERIDRIIEKVKLYGCDDGIVRGLIFCNKKEECIQLSIEFNNRGFKTIALTDKSTDKERSDAINRLESNLSEEKVDYLFTVDIFNEGVDIPRVNQIVMLRPTQSAIIFIQQLGRGLRKIESKEYLTVVDFIGNYNNNYLLPIALYGDTSYNKDNLRKFMSSGSSLIPGSSTINFDKITKERIFEAITKAKLQLKIDLVSDYQNLKYKLGRVPFMIDFIHYGSRDPYHFVLNSNSYFNFILSQENNYDQLLSIKQLKYLELFSKEIANGKRIEEVLLFKEIIIKSKIDVKNFKEILHGQYGLNISDATVNSCIENLNFDFVGKRVDTIYKNESKIILYDTFIDLIKNESFVLFLKDTAEYAIEAFKLKFEIEKYFDGFILYQKYSRKDVFRILNWNRNPNPQNVGGYLVNSERTLFPIFITYNKKEDISNSIKYDDGFINKGEFKWESKNNRTLKSPEIELLKNYSESLRVLLFIQKSNDEGIDFYYMGDIVPIENSFEQIVKNNGKDKVVEVRFSMKYPVEDTIYNYLTSYQEDEIKTEIVDSNYSGLFRILPFNEIEPYENCIPLYDIKAAAGDFSKLQINEETLWIEFATPFKYSQDYFVCKVVGESMNKDIPNNSWCLFKKDFGGSRNGQIVLVHHFNIQDPDFGKAFTIKKYESSKTVTEDSHHQDSIVLKPNSYDREFKNIVLTKDELIDLEVVGIFVKVLS